MGMARWIALVALGSAVTWGARRAWGRRSGALARWRTGLGCDVVKGAVRWSGSFLRSMGAVQSAPRAEQEALLAQRIRCALADRLEGAADGISVLIIGGVIHLEGRVPNPEAMAEAERVARQVSGAEVLADDLRVP